MEIKDSKVPKDILDYLVRSITCIAPFVPPDPLIDKVQGYCMEAIKSCDPGKPKPLPIVLQRGVADITPIIGGREYTGITQELFAVENFSARDSHGDVKRWKYIPLCFIMISASASIDEKDNKRMVNFEEKVHFCRKDVSEMSSRNYECEDEICVHDEFQYMLDRDLNDFCFAINEVVKHRGTTGVIFRLRYCSRDVSSANELTDAIFLDKVYLTLNDLSTALETPSMFRVIEKFGMKTVEEFNSHINVLFSGAIDDILNGSILTFKYSKDIDGVLPNIVRPINRNQMGNHEKPKFLGEKMGEITNNEIPLAPITIPGKVDVITNHLRDGISSLVGNGYAYHGIKGMMKSVKALLKNEDFVMKIAEVCVDIDNATEEGLYGIDDMYSKSYNRFFFDAVIDNGPDTEPYRIKRVDVTRPIDDRLLDILSDKQKIFVGLKLEEVAVPFGKSQTAQRLSLVIRNESLEARKELKFLTHLRLSKYITNIRGEGNVNI